MWGFIITGQSLAVGADILINKDGQKREKIINLTKSCNSKNVYMMKDGPVNNNLFSNEIIRFKENFNSMTISSSFIDGIRHEYNDNLNLCIHGCALGGAPMSYIEKNGKEDIYKNIINQVRIMSNKFKNIQYKAIILIHGESDGLFNNNKYYSQIHKLIKNYNDDIELIVKQEKKIPLLLCQTSSAAHYINYPFLSPLQQLKAHKKNKNIYLVCPKYQFDYVDSLHIDYKSQFILGAYYKKAFMIIRKFNNFEPLSPKSIIASNNKILIIFKGNVGNLVFDTTNVKYIDNYGFNYFENNKNCSHKIKNIVIKRKNRIKIILNSPNFENSYLSYAYKNGINKNNLGDRGNVRDSDTSKYKGFNLYNWCVIFKQKIIYK